ncbi:MAG: 6-pyruvoyl tetrahydropterin synthase family protein, partial [Planctomycetaceae bacterium]
MQIPDYTVRVTKDHLVFSAAHFITFNGNICERLHGHNWRVAATVTGPLDENSYVFDFIALRDGLQDIVNGLDHRMLVATKHPTIKVNAGETEVELTFEDRRWIFPAKECVLLPIANATAELLAHWIALRVSEKLSLSESQLTELT